MLKVYTSENRFLVYNIKNILEQQGIECVVKNDQVGSASGEVPTIECWPELWVMDDGQFGQAERVVNDHINEKIPEGPKWICKSCGEEHEPQFSSCWKCDGKESVDL